jgi:hypothetical protein
MMMRKAAVITGFLLVMLAILPVQHADAIQTGDTISLTWAPWNTGSSGGEFTVSDYTTKAALFTTFCIEPNEYFYLGEKLTVQSVGTTILYNGGSTPIALNSQVAFLYHEFAHNSWDEAGIFNYTNSDARRADDLLLQQAIWQLQYGGVDEGNKFIKYINDYYGVSGWQGYGDVAVISLAGASGNKQDQLALVPEPMTLILLGTGLVGVGIFRKRMK